MSFKSCGVSTDARGYDYGDAPDLPHQPKSER